MESNGKLAIVAVGGNALIVDKHHESIPDQFVAASSTAHFIVDMVESGWNVVITHGSGPQIGFILRRSEIARDVVPMVPARTTTFTASKRWSTRIFRPACSPAACAPTCSSF